MVTTMSMTNGDEGPVLIRTRELRDRYGGVSDTWVDRRLTTDPDFPKPVYIANRRFWKLEQLKEYERGLPPVPQRMSA